YTEALIMAAPHPALKGQRLPTIPGSPPRPGRFESGCRFAPRCSYATEGCRAAPPPLDNVLGHEVRCIRHDELSLSASMDGVPT
ncbi:MAG: dipeptide ABC transporter ATP-binding protein, partial [Acidimicrobiales bacterium]|nr:dipeptide ABC transporter ATP-binding protein [Acidimicrobiales bacterium]